MLWSDAPRGGIGAVDPFSMLAGAGLMLVLASSLWTARRLLARGIPEAPPNGRRAGSALAALRDELRDHRHPPPENMATLAQVDEIVAARVATLRADFNAIAESVDSNLDAIDRTRRRVAARRDPPPPDARPPTGISPMALSFLQGHR
jgi:hypothetical protein